jgi:hypothetical protein
MTIASKVIKINDTAVQILHRCDFGPHIPEALDTFKGNIYRKNKHREIVLHYIYSFPIKNMEVNKRYFLVTAVVVDFLHEFESILKKVLTRVSGAQGELFDEKSQRSKLSCQGT